MDHQFSHQQQIIFGRGEINDHIRTTICSPEPSMKKSTSSIRKKQYFFNGVIIVRLAVMSRTLPVVEKLLTV